jgi:hypothetical protein
VDDKFDFDVSAREPPWMVEEDVPVGRPPRAARESPAPVQAPGFREFHQWGMFGGQDGAQEFRHPQSHIITEMGFPEEVALAALIRSKGDLDRALALLLD